MGLPKRHEFHHSLKCSVGDNHLRPPTNMADKQEDPQVRAKKQQESLIVSAKKWGESSVPPAALATFVFAQHARPFQGLPMIFPPLLLFSTYLNLQGFKIDSAGTTAALSGAYLVIVGRRRQGVWNKFGTRGIIRGATMGLALANVVGGGLAYAFGSRRKEDEEKDKL